MWPDVLAGKYAVFVGLAYAVTVAGLVGASTLSWLSHRGAARRLAALESADLVGQPIDIPAKPKA